MTKEEFFKHAKTNINNLLETALSDAYNQGVTDTRNHAVHCLVNALADHCPDCDMRNKITKAFWKEIK